MDSSTVTRCEKFYFLNSPDQKMDAQMDIWQAHSYIFHPKSHPAKSSFLRCGFLSRLFPSSINLSSLSVHHPPLCVETGQSFVHTSKSLGIFVQYLQTLQQGVVLYIYKFAETFYVYGMQFYCSKGDWWLLRWITRWIFLSVYYTSFPFFSYCQIHCHFSRQSIKFCLTTLCTLLFFLHFNVRARWMEALLRHSNITVHMEDKDDGCSLQLSLSQTLLQLMCVRACRGCYI